ncbi:MAG: restriction endonuclease subunit S [Clostridiales bacterium]|nr:restriction endonuclease subunit S [Clostridiales bacterium]
MGYKFLGDIAKLRNENIKDNSDDSLLYVTTAHLLPEKRGLDSNLESSLNKSGKHFYKGDILVSNIRPYFKKIWFATSDGITSNDVLIFTPKEGVDLSYLYYLLMQDTFFDYATKTSKGTKMPRGDKSALKQFEVYIPKLEMQVGTSKKLKSFDKKIETNNAIIANLEAQAQAIFKSRFVDFELFQDGQFVESELGMIPEGWEVKTLGDFFPVITGKKNANIAIDNGEYPFFTCSQGIFYTDDYSFDANAILLAGNGDFNVKRYNGKFEAYQRTYILIPYDEKYVGLLYNLIEFYLPQIVSGHKGSVINYITKGMIEEFKFAVPNDMPAKTLKLFNDYENFIAHLKKEVKNLEITRDTLLPKLMSGEIRVGQDDIEEIENLL